MDILVFENVKGELVRKERAFNAESDIAVVRDKIRFDFKFKAGCKHYYDKVEPYKVLYQPKDVNQVIDYIKGLKGRILTQEDNFDRIMREEGLRALLGNVRLHRINFQIKTVSDGKKCEPCIC